MYYYVYRITNILERKHYYGSSRSTILPSKHLGVRYFSSSVDNDFILDQKANPNNYKYKVVKIFNSREEAFIFEAKIHEKFDVRHNSNFYNRCNQTINCTNFNKMIVIDKNTGISKRISKEEYLKSDNYIPIAKNKTPVFNKILNKYHIVDSEDYHNYDYLTHPSKDRISVYDKIDDVTKSISKEEYINNKERYQGVNKGKINGKNNPNKKIIKIFDSVGVLQFYCEGNFKEVCLLNDLPLAILQKSAYNNGEPIYSKRKCTIPSREKYNGWYAIIE